MTTDLKGRIRDCVAVAMGVGVLLVLVITSQSSESDAVAQVQQVSQQRDEAVADGKSIAQQAIAICAKGGPAAAAMGQLCKNAVAVAQKPPPTPVQADSLTESRARQLVREELVSNNLVLSPVVTDQLARVAAGFVRPVPGPTGSPGNPGSPGPAGPSGAPGTPQTEEEARGLVRAALATVCGDDGSGCRGPAGEAGKDAPPVSDEQRAADLAAYCGQQGSPCRGPSPFPFVFVFRIDDRQITCRIEYAGDSPQACETVVIAPPPASPEPSGTPSTGG